MRFGKTAEWSQNAWLSLIAILGLAIAAGCGGCIKPASPPGPAATSSGSPDKPSTTEAAASTGTVNIEGSSTVYLIAQAMAVEFEKTGDYKVSLGRSGTGGGYKKFALRQCDLWNASRPIADKEKAELKEKGIDWLELEVGIDGISIAVNPKNDWCTELTVGELRSLWKPDSTVMKWSDLNAQWPAEKIELFGADADSGTFEYFTEVIVGKKGSTRTKYQAAADDNVLIQGVSRSKYSLGYIPFGYCVENTDKVKVIKVSPTVDPSETPAPANAPTNDTILSGEYKPLSRPLYVYANRETLGRPEIAAYLRFLMSATAQPLVSARGFVRIPEERRKEMSDRLESAIVGDGKATESTEKPAEPEANTTEADSAK